MFIKKTEYLSKTEHSPILKFMFMLLLSFSLLVPQIAFAASPNKISFTIAQMEYTSDGNMLSMDVSPFIENNRTYVPVRFLALSLGVPEANIGWDSTIAAVTLKKDDTTVVLKIGSMDLSVNGTSSTMDAAPIIRNSRTFLPARYVAEAFGFNVSWDENSKTINIVLPMHMNYQVSIQDFSFSPASVTINAGDSITWTNRDSMGHTATSDSFDSGSLGYGQSFTYTFKDSGTFNYICSFHPGMKGVVIVK
jgi:plastocyanin